MYLHFPACKNFGVHQVDASGKESKVFEKLNSGLLIEGSGREFFFKVLSSAFKRYLQKVPYVV